MSYSVEIKHIQDFTFKAKTAGCELIIDTKGKGISPPDALLASLGSCVGVYIRKYAEGAKLNLANFTITVKAEFSKIAPVAFALISVSVDLKGAELDERRKKSLLEFIKNCPVHNTLKGNPEIEINFYGN
ncbi:MAG: OsmC family protein [Candidatus Omnitrophica bacterium]|nr:OsmC family protein [Candidatus Omnitrophota bacterium]MDD5238085.1 OsmC family protein [Candidatus Omnitrophota bacterium]